MTTSHFHVFLPPTLLPLSAFTPDSPISEGLIFHDLPRRPESQPFSSSLARRHSQLPKATPERTQQHESIPTVKEADEVESFDDSFRAPAVPSKRPREEANALSALPTSTKGQSTQPRAIDASRALGPRRSARVSRTSAAFLTVPTNDFEETFQTLNTTATNTQPSQPPLPNWSIPLSKLVSLHALLSGQVQAGRYQQNTSTRIDLMVCVMAVETLQQLKRKEERANGQEGTLWLGEWRITAPPEGAQGQAAGSTEVSCPVKLWDKMARAWGDGQVRRGDVLLLENVEYKPPTAKDPGTITISSGTSTALSSQPRVTILYRTLVRRTANRADYLPARGTTDKRDFVHPAENAGQIPRILAEDEALRPDLRLSRSDAGVRKVAEWAGWFANWIGGEAP